MEIKTEIKTTQANKIAKKLLYELRFGCTTNLKSCPAEILKSPFDKHIRDAFCYTLFPELKKHHRSLCMNECGCCPCIGVKEGVLTYEEVIDKLNSLKNEENDFSFSYSYRPYY